MLPTGAGLGQPSRRWTADGGSPYIEGVSDSSLQRRGLQILNGLVGLATLALGTLQMAFGARSPLYAAATLPDLPALDSNLRFFGGLGVGLGLVLLWTLPAIERRTVAFRAVWLCAFIGGVGRLVSAAAVGAPSNPLVLFAWLETVGAPAIVYWHHRLARSGRPRSG
jgi:hypothetical protein